MATDTDVRRVVDHYAREIGCNESNCAAAVAWAIRFSTLPLAAISAGRHRAHVLLDRQQHVFHLEGTGQ